MWHMREALRLCDKWEKGVTWMTGDPHASKYFRRAEYVAPATLTKYWYRQWSLKLTWSRWIAHSSQSWHRQNIKNILRYRQWSAKSRLQVDRLKERDTILQPPLHQLIPISYNTQIMNHASHMHESWRLYAWGYMCDTYMCDTYEYVMTHIWKYDTGSAK